MKKYSSILLFLSCICTGCKTSNACMDKATVTTVNACQLEQLLQRPDLLLIDVRTPEEYAQGHIYRSVNIDVKKKDFKRKIRKYPRQKTVAVYCKGGVRSLKAADILRQNGFKVYNLEGGYLSWEKEFK